MAIRNRGFFISKWSPGASLEDIC